MLKLDQDTFITQFVTIFLATEMATNTHCITPSERWKRPPVEDAVRAARMAWMELISHYDINQTAKG